MMEIKDSYATAGGAEKVVGPDTPSDKTDGIYITARYSDIDMVDHVNNASYVRWLMDDMPHKYQQKHSLKKLNINYLNEGFLGDKLKVVQTTNTDAMLIHEILNTDTEKVICRMNSFWQDRE
jgi:acyl-ACP thioesterase